MIHPSTPGAGDREGGDGPSASLRGAPRRVLDLFCGEGGVSAGLKRAWPDAEILGIDWSPKERYPFRFMQIDIRDILAYQGSRSVYHPIQFSGFDFIWASPPCQRYARIGAVHGVRENHLDLIEPVRQALVRSGRPWVIENVPDSKMPNSVTLCGSMFGLGATGPDGVYRQLRRHRLFQASFHILTPQCQHQGEPVGVYGRGGPQTASRNRGYMGGKREREDAMGITWMSREGLSNAIPPAYSQYIAEQYSARLRAPEASSPKGPLPATPEVTP